VLGCLKETKLVQRGREVQSRTCHPLLGDLLRGGNFVCVGVYFQRFIVFGTVLGC